MRVKPGCAATAQNELSVQTSRVTRRTCPKMAVGQTSRLSPLRLGGAPSRTTYALVACRRAPTLTFERESSQRARSDSRFTLPSRLLHGVKMRHGSDVKYAVGRRRSGADRAPKFDR